MPDESAVIGVPAPSFNAEVKSCPTIQFGWLNNAGVDFAYLIESEASFPTEFHMKTEKPPSATLLTLAEHTSKVLALVAATLLIMSVWYDYSYLSAVGLSFNEVPSLTAEHVRSALLWGPYMALMLLGAAMQELFLRRMENGLSEEEILAKSSPAMRRFRESPPKVALASVALCTVASIFTSTDYGWVYIAFIPCWIVLAISIVNHKRMGAGFTRTGRMLFGVLPMVIALIGWHGHNQGSKLLSGTTPSWELTIRVGTATTKQAVIGLRRFSTFAIAVDEGRFVSIIPNDAILSARLLNKAGPGMINLCRWFDLGCPRIVPTVTAPLPTKPTLQPRQNVIGPIAAVQ